LCSTTLTALTASTSSGACSDEASLSLACDGQITRSAALCAQDSATSLWSDDAVRSCLRSEPSLEAVPDACLDCYADELRCTLSHCLVSCVTAVGDECSACRAQQCGAAFSLCSGISAH
jgi:hypothetical protein